MNELVASAVVLLVILSGVAFAIDSRRRRVRRRVPIRAIASADETAVIRIRGSVHAPSPLAAPLTGRACVYYRVEFCHGRVTSEHAEACDFTVRDTGGLAQVVVDGARFEVVADIVETGRASDLTDRARAVLGRLDIAIPHIASMELREAIVGVEDPIDILGHAVREPAPEASAVERGFRDPHATMLVFSGDVQVLGSEREALYIGER